MIDAADDVGHDGFGGVVDTSLFAQGGIVAGEEGFVEVQDGVFPGRVGTKVFEDGGDGTVGEGGGDVLDESGVGFVVKVEAVDGVEELAEQRVGFGDVGGGGSEGEVVAGVLLVVVAGGGKKAVCEGLGEEVGELRGLLVVGEGGQELADGVANELERLGRFPDAVRLDDDVADHVGLACQTQGQIAGLANGLRAAGQEISEQLGDGILSGVGGADLAGDISDRAERCGGDAVAIDVVPEVHIVGEQQVWQVLAIALELLGLVGVGEGDTDVFGFDVAYGQATLFAKDHVVRRAAGALSGLVNRVGLSLSSFRRP